MSTVTLSSHRFPPGAFPQNYNSRYSDVTCSGPFLRDAHEENPESILDDHVQRVMKTPGCQSPGTGRHSPKPHSPDFPGGRGMGLAMPMSSGQGKHPPRHGFKGESSHLYHHKHVQHIHHTGIGKPKEQVEAEAAMRVHSSFPWGMETNHYGSKSRSYADGMGFYPMEHLGYRYTQNSLLSISFLFAINWPKTHFSLLLTSCFLPLNSSKGGTQCKRVYKKGEDVRTYDMPGPAEEMEKNQKILLWLMEGQKEMVQHKRSPYGSVASVNMSASIYVVMCCVLGVRYYCLYHQERFLFQCSSFVCYNLWWAQSSKVMNILYILGAPLDPKGPQVLQQLSGRDLCTRAAVLNCGTMCSRLTLSSRIPPCPPTQLPALSSSWKRFAGGLRRRRWSLEHYNPSKGRTDLFCYQLSDMLVNWVFQQTCFILIHNGRSQICPLSFLSISQNEIVTLLFSGLCVS